MKNKVKLCVLALSVLVAACKKNQNNVTDVSTESFSPNNNGKLMLALPPVNSESALKAAVANAKPGDVITISGVINLTSTLVLAKSGTAQNKITLKGGELNCKGIGGKQRGVEVNGNYWEVREIKIHDAPDNGLITQYNASFNHFYKVTTYNNQDTGLQLGGTSHDNLVDNCISFGNNSILNGGEDADGFACKRGAGAKNVFESCEAYGNSDDGWDLYNQPYTVVINNCKSHDNGKNSNGDGNGFKLGGKGDNTPHTVTNCNSYNNKAHGYTGNGNIGKITLTNSKGSGNGKSLFDRIF